MKKIYRVTSAIILLLVLPWPVFVLAGEAKKNIIIVSDIGLSTPEAIRYYPAENVYLVTNINGGLFAADDNGFISKLNSDGGVVALKWIDGAKKGVKLNAPKGIAISGKNLFVADINQVRVFELPSGKQKKSISIKGATFLNGVASGPDGSVYVVDSGYNEGFTPSGTDAIYRVWASGKYKAIVKDKEMAHPNGIWNDKDKNQLVVNTFGSGKIFSIDASGKQTGMPMPPNGGLDGLAKLKDGRFIVSSWNGSAIYVMEMNGKFSVLADSLDAPADFGVDTKSNRLLIPLFKQNKIAILPY